MQRRAPYGEGGVFRGEDGEPLLSDEGEGEPYAPPTNFISKGWRTARGTGWNGVQTCMLGTLILMLVLIAAVLGSILGIFVGPLYKTSHNTEDILETAHAIYQDVLELAEANGYNAREFMATVLPRNNQELLSFGDDVVNGFRGTMSVMRQVNELDLFGVLVPVLDKIDVVFHADAAPAVTRSIGNIVRYLSLQADAGNIDQAGRLIESTVDGITRAIRDPGTMDTIRSFERVTTAWLSDPAVRTLLGDFAGLTAQARAVGHEMMTLALSDRTRHMIDRMYYAAETATEGDKIQQWVALAQEMSESTARLVHQMADEGVVHRMRDMPELVGNITELLRAVRADFKNSGLLIRFPERAPDDAIALV